MIELWVLIAMCLSGFILYISTYKEIEAFLHFDFNKGILIPFLIIVVLSVFVAQYIHLSESAARASDESQTVIVYGCIIENLNDCTTMVNTLNNESYTKVMNGEKATFYIPFSLQHTLFSNTLSYFFVGVLLAIIFNRIRMWGHVTKP